ncbi:MAG: YgiQ family radical SAM protein [Prevotellaceae bacterium]|jgi:uncharacterized radical SAM protein YgiQ|nr:YgiQ family radical SAM protein [Prevotellaceae bacterium]
MKALRSAFPPSSPKEMSARGWDCADVVFFSGDAYVDHPAFGAAVIVRTLESIGLRVAIVPQPNWTDDLRDFRKFGPPRLFFAVSAGAMDSMVNRYTANKRTRSDDAYTPDARPGARPDRAATVYVRILKRLYPQIPVVAGGIEASLRRFTHYDFWDDALRPPFSIDSGADYLIYGQGERAVKELVGRLKAGADMFDLPQTAFVVPKSAAGRFAESALTLNSHEQCCADADKFGANFRAIETESNSAAAKRLLQACGELVVVVNPPYPAAAAEELDAIHDLPFARRPHPRYADKRIPAHEMIKHSITLHRGCFGGCSFCTISAHQGKFISSRSPASVLREVDAIAAMPDFRGHISDLGGPAANMYMTGGHRAELCLSCRRPSCLFPRICRNLNVDHSPLTELYAEVRRHPAVRKVTIGSGIRYDMFLTGEGFIDEAGRRYFETLVKHHVSGRLKVAPEHSSPAVLQMVRKPSFDLFVRLKKEFDEINRRLDLRQQLIPYFVSCLPGCADEDMRRLAAEARRLRCCPEQTQCFTPTPMTLASTVFYTGKDPYSGKRVRVVKSAEGRKRQHLLIKN